MCGQSGGDVGCWGRWYACCVVCFVSAALCVFVLSVSIKEDQTEGVNLRRWHLKMWACVF